MNFKNDSIKVNIAYFLRVPQGAYITFHFIYLIRFLGLEIT